VGEGGESTKNSVIGGGGGTTKKSDKGWSGPPENKERKVITQKRGSNTKSFPEEPGQCECSRGPRCPEKGQHEFLVGKTDYQKGRLQGFVGDLPWRYQLLQRGREQTFSPARGAWGNRKKRVRKPKLGGNKFQETPCA